MIRAIESLSAMSAMPDTFEGTRDSTASVSTPKRPSSQSLNTPQSSSSRSPYFTPVRSANFSNANASYEEGMPGSMIKRLGDALAKNSRDNTQDMPLTPESLPRTPNRAKRHRREDVESGSTTLRRSRRLVRMKDEEIAHDLKCPRVVDNDAEGTSAIKKRRRARIAKNGGEEIEFCKTGQIVESHNENSEIQSKRKRSKSTSRRKVKTELKHTIERVCTKDEGDVSEPLGKIWLIQEKLRHDPWKMLVATNLLNRTTGRAANPIREEIFKRWPSAKDLAEASMTDLAELLYPLGLFNQRAGSLIRFSSQYVQLGWPLITNLSSSGSSIRSNTNFAMNGDTHLDLKHEIPPSLDVTIFYGAGTYASDSFRIFSPLYNGGGAPAEEGNWIEKRNRALLRCKKNRSFRSDVGKIGHQPDVIETGEEHCLPSSGEIDEYLSDCAEDQDDGDDEWRKVRPSDKELRRYLVWRWGIEGISYDINRGPNIIRERDIKRLSTLIQTPAKSR